MGLLGLGAEFRMELHGDEPGMIGNLDDFRQVLVGIGPGDREAGRLELSAILGIEFIPMAVPLAD